MIVLLSVIDFLQKHVQRSEYWILRLRQWLCNWVLWLELFRCLNLWNYLFEWINSLFFTLSDHLVLQGSCTKWICQMKINWLWINLLWHYVLISHWNFFKQWLIIFCRVDSLWKYSLHFWLFFSIGLLLFH